MMWGQVSVNLNRNRFYSGKCSGGRCYNSIGPNLKERRWRGDDLVGHKTAGSDGGSEAVRHQFIDVKPHTKLISRVG